jgi:UDP-N-acetylmuramoylalanine--D-glutamate ligase
MELSSFQLDLMTSSPQVACITNLAPNHLDRHATLEAYVAAKVNIFAHQSATDTLVLGADDPAAWALHDQASGRVWAFSAQPLPQAVHGATLSENAVILEDEDGPRELFTRDQIELRGAHNTLNVLAACALAAVAGIPDEAIREGVRGFRGVPHRLEFVRELGSVAWYNDSKATVPAATMAAMAAFTGPLVVLVGGRDKNLPWDEFAALARARARKVIVFGEAGDLIEKALHAAVMTQYVRVADLQSAVTAAYRAALPGDVVLLAPGATSFDEFTDFEDRGDHFKQWVLALQPEGVRS